MPPVKIVYASTSCTTGTPDGGFIQLSEGEPWASDDPIVLTHPDLFSSFPPPPNFPRRSVAAVEQATAAPGEKRAYTRRG